MIKAFIISFIETSPPEFSSVYPKYMHRRKVLYDSGAKVSSLSEIIYISLDTFQSVVQNINTELEAWLMFSAQTAMECFAEGWHC